MSCVRVSITTRTSIES